MGNFKVKVNSEAESKEAQELFFELGYGWRGVNPKNSIFIPKKLKEYFIINYENTKDMQLSGIFDNSETLTARKEITLPELRAMVKPSLNDQYAEIEQVRQTLNERQSQYGEFANVAETTAMFMDHFIPDRLSYVQREALHMICSKLARIANGDPNHVDSWHDIAGYATLVVDDLES